MFGVSTLRKYPALRKQHGVPGFTWKKFKNLPTISLWLRAFAVSYLVISEMALQIQPLLI